MNDRAVPVRLQRRFPHAIERVFAAFSTAEAIASWLSPADEITLIVERFHFAVEGAYLFHYLDPNGSRVSLTGRFLTIDPPCRLSMTWQWLPPDVHAGIESVVLVTLAQEDDGCLLTVLHERLRGVDMPARHAAGWAGALTRLSHYLIESEGDST